MTQILNGTWMLVGSNSATFTLFTLVWAIVAMSGFTGLQERNLRKNQNQFYVRIS